MKHNLICWILSCLPIVFYLTNLYAMTGHSMLPYLVVAYFTGIIGMYKMISDDTLNRHFIITFFVIYIITEIFALLVNDNVDFGDIARSSVLFCITVVMLRYPFGYYVGMAQFYTTIFFFIGLLLSGALYEEIFVNTSHNYVSVIVLLSLLIYFVGINIKKWCFSIWCMNI